MEKASNTISVGKLCLYIALFIYGFVLSTSRRIQSHDLFWYFCLWRQKDRKERFIAVILALVSIETVSVWNALLYKNLKLIEVKLTIVTSYWSWCFEWYCTLLAMAFQMKLKGASEVKLMFRVVACYLWPLRRSWGVKAWNINFTNSCEV